MNHSTKKKIVSGIVFSVIITGAIAVFTMIFFANPNDYYGLYKVKNAHIITFLVIIGGSTTLTVLIMAFSHKFYKTLVFWISLFPIVIGIYFMLSITDPLTLFMIAFVTYLCNLFLSKDMI